MVGFGRKNWEDEKAEVPLSVRGVTSTVYPAFLYCTYCNARTQSSCRACVPSDSPSSDFSIDTKSDKHTRTAAMRPALVLRAKHAYQPMIQFLGQRKNLPKREFPFWE